MAGGQGDNSSGNIAHSGTTSSDGFQTSTANLIIVFDGPVNSFFIIGETLSDVFTIKFNGEASTHPVSSEAPFALDGMRIDKFEIIENGMSYRYEALFA